ncbi:hypothetical protein GGI07_004932 [Coemansia sp. Benny D115]|nr:hypothetical protein GGI07_004932 [Coemansia sp. Benny D115]
MSEIVARGFLFDMDGTLVDTTAQVEKSWLSKAAQFNVNGPELLKHIHGRTCLDTLRTHFPVETHTVEYARAFELECVYESDGIRAVQGAHKVLKLLHPSKWAVVTAASRTWATVKMGQAGLPAPANLISAENVEKGKPHPEGYLKGAEILQQDIGEIVVFEDAINGVKAGLSAGATVIAVVTSTSRQELIDAGAHYVVDDFTKISVTVNDDLIKIKIQD